jgi:archaellum component FlaC
MRHEPYSRENLGESSVIGWIAFSEVFLLGVVVLLATTLFFEARVRRGEIKTRELAGKLETATDQGRYQSVRLDAEKRRIETLMAELKAAIDRLTRVQAELETITAEGDAAKAQAKAASHKIAELNRQLQELARIVKERTAEVAHLKTELAKRPLPSARVHQELLGIKGDMKKVAILLDHSGSMNIATPGPGNRTRWQYCLEIVKTWVRHLEMERCILVVFSTEAKVFPEGGGMFEVKVEGRVADQKKLEEILDGLKTPNGATNTLEALKKAYAVPDLSSIILFTDGKPEDDRTASLRSNPEAARLHTEMLQAQVYALIERSQNARAVPINTVGLGDYFKPELSAFLMKVSELTGGVFIGR